MDLHVKLLHLPCAVKRKADHLEQPAAKRQKKSPQTQAFFSPKIPSKLQPNASSEIKNNNSFSI